MLPMAIRYGMPVYEFWEEDPDLFWVYRISYIDKTMEEEERQNMHNWMLGLYIQSAVGSIFSKNAKYMQKPIPMFPDRVNTNETPEEKKRRENLEIMHTLKAQLAAKKKFIEREANKGKSKSSNRR